MSAIRIERRGPVGLLLLCQPATLNALTLRMIESLHESLQILEADDTIKLIVLRSDTERAFCAGGDMKHIRLLCMAQDYTAVDEFFKTEYALNLAIARCSKPYLALIDGVAMGGGLGISVLGRFRVVSERAVLSMPETRIGFFPDVGASWFLPRLPQRCGYWLALTAASVTGMQAVKCALATHYVTSLQQAALLKALEHRLAESSVSADTSEAAVAQCLSDFAEPCSVDSFDQNLLERADWFADDTLPGISQRLQAASEHSADAANLLTLLDSASPYSISTTLKLLRDAQGLDLTACLQLELAAGRLACRHPDLIEGVRAVLVDKDRHAHWQ